MAESRSEHSLLFLVHARTPLHVGVGDSLGDINLPTMRESLTGHPIIPGSSIKGILRDHASQQLGERSPELQVAFGPEKGLAGGADRARGGLVFSDASLLCLPVRSLYGTFAWVTCPLILHRLARDASQADRSFDGLEALRKALGTPDHALVANGSALLPPQTQDDKATKQVQAQSLYLQELKVSAKTSADVETLGKALARTLFSGDEVFQTFFWQRLMVVPDNWFAALCQSALEVRARIKIDPATGTAAGSGPWKEEYLPTESLLFGLMIGRRTGRLKASGEQGKESGDAPAQNSMKKVEPSEPVSTLRNLLRNAGPLRLGGKSSVGAGRLQITLVGEG